LSSARRDRQERTLAARAEEQALCPVGPVLVFTQIHIDACAEIPSENIVFMVSMVISSGLAVGGAMCPAKIVD